MMITFGKLMCCYKVKKKKIHQCRTPLLLYQLLLFFLSVDLLNQTIPIKGKSKAKSCLKNLTSFALTSELLFNAFWKVHTIWYIFYLQRLCFWKSLCHTPLLRGTFISLVSIPGLFFLPQNKKGMRRRRWFLCSDTYWSLGLNSICARVG